MTARRPALLRGHVLVADDDPEVRDALVALLDDAGYAVTLAADGGEALARLQAGLLPDAIVTDLSMPRMDGWALCAALARDPVLAAIPVIVLSAMGAAGAAGPGDVTLPKPLAGPRLLAELARRVRG